jgi:hypothetical protein
MCGAVVRQVLIMALNAADQRTIPYAPLDDVQPTVAARQPTQVDVSVTPCIQPDWCRQRSRQHEWCGGGGQMPVSHLDLALAIVGRHTIESVEPVAERSWFVPASVTVL